MGSNITATVGLPMYKAASIGFLALESLCRQEGVDFGWELIVIEETDNAFTEERLREYESRLSGVGCQRVVYIGLDEWIPLSLKWLRLADNAAESSKIMFLQAADCFSQPNRLKNTIAIFESEHCDWVQSPLGAFFDVATGNMSIFDAELIEEYAEPYKGWAKHPTALNMALSLDLLKKVEPQEMRRGVDGWLFFSMQDAKGEKLKVSLDTSEDWKKGADTHGFNQISIARGMFIESLEPPFRAGDELTVDEIMPAEVLEVLVPMRLSAMENQIEQLHRALKEEFQLKREVNEKLENFRGMIRRRDEKIEKMEKKLAEAKEYSGGKKRGLFRKK